MLVDKPPTTLPGLHAKTFPAGHAPTLRRIGVLHHPKIPASDQLAEDIATRLQQLGAQTWVGSTWDEEAVRAQTSQLDLLVVLGGDGSMLRAARMGAQHGVPLVGINLGRLGFLVEIRPDEWREVLPRVLDGGYRIEERMMLKAESRRGEELLGQHDALNDVVVSRGSLARIVRLHTHIDGDHLTQYVADGLIVATATGSTAYALAAGGPILPPTLKNILLIPIAPHLSMERAIVLDQGATVDMRIVTDHQAILTVDGQFEFTLLDGDRVTVKASSHVARFVRVHLPSYFYRTLMERLRMSNDE
jgi:NAD+ kinase